MITQLRIAMLILQTCTTTLIAHELVNITAINPHIQLDIRYATTNNFTKKKIYSGGYCFLQKPVARALNNVQKELELLGLGLTIFDGYRPLSVQKIFWDLVPDERYVANPTKGSRHNRGCAVDVTLIKADGSAVLMPTEFDDFTTKAHRDYRQLPPEAIANRDLLTTIMTKHGFIGLPTEWWHFDYKTWEEYPILDISFEELI